MGLNVNSPLGAYRNYQINTNSVGESTKKLSSGDQVNSAADDAAGLAISQKMRPQAGAQDAESEIRDLDIAQAVMENTKKKILSQSSQFMLAQANQRASDMMGLLR